MSIGCPFFPIYQEKMPIVMPIFKKHSALKPIFCQKNVHSLKKLYSHVILSQFFMKHALPSSPNLVNRTVNYVKTAVYFESDKSIGCPLSIFH